MDVKPHPYLSARSRACPPWTSRNSRWSALVPTSTISGLSQYALACSWPAPTQTSHLDPFIANNNLAGGVNLRLKFKKSQHFNNGNRRQATGEETLMEEEYWSEAEEAAEMTRTHPVPDVEETLLIGQVKHQQEAHGVSEESCSEAAESEKHTQRTHNFYMTSSTVLDNHRPYIKPAQPQKIKGIKRILWNSGHSPFHSKWKCLSLIWRFLLFCNQTNWMVHFTLKKN